MVTYRYLRPITVKMTSKTRILITGISGFLGTYIARYLSTFDRFEILGLVRADSDCSLLASFDGDINYIEGDVLDIPMLEQACKEVDVIIHAAAEVSFHAAYRKQMYRTNVQGTANVVNCALAETDVYLLHISSIAAIGRHPAFREITEETEWIESDHNTHYAESKYRADLEVERGFAEGLQGAILHPGVILGSFHWDRGTQQFFKSALQGLQVYPVGESSFVDVREVVQAVARLVQLRIADRHFIVAGHNASYQKVLTQIAEALDQKPPKIAFTDTLLRLAKPVSTLLEWVLPSWKYTPEVMGNLSQSYYYDSSRSEEELDLTYRPLTATVKEIAAIWKANFPHHAPQLLEFP